MVARTRRRVRLTRGDWRAAYIALAFVAGTSAVVRASLSEAIRTAARRALRKIGVDGMAARDRGVAPVVTRARPKAPRF